MDHTPKCNKSPTGGTFNTIPMRRPANHKSNESNVWKDVGAVQNVQEQALCDIHHDTDCKNLEANGTRIFFLSTRNCSKSKHCQSRRCCGCLFPKLWIQGVHCHPHDSLQHKIWFNALYPCYSLVTVKACTQRSARIAKKLRQLELSQQENKQLRFIPCLEQTGL